MADKKKRKPENIFSLNLPMSDGVGDATAYEFTENEKGYLQTLANKQDRAVRKVATKLLKEAIKAHKEGRLKKTKDGNK